MEAGSVRQRQVRTPLHKPRALPEDSLGESLEEEPGSRPRMRPLSTTEQALRGTLTASIGCPDLCRGQRQEQPGQPEQVRCEGGIRHQRAFSRQDRSQWQESRRREKYSHQQPGASTGQAIHPAQVCRPEKLDHYTSQKPAAESYQKEDEHETHQHSRPIFNPNQGARNRYLVAQCQPPSQGQEPAHQQQADQTLHRAEKHGKHAASSDSDIQSVQDHVLAQHFNTWAGRDECCAKIPSFSGQGKGPWRRVMKPQHLIAGFPAGRFVSCAILLFLLCLPASSLPAQDLHEIMSGSVGRIEEDFFACGRQQHESVACGLSYRYYCVDVPGEVNSPAVPSGGFASYRPQRRLYMARPAHTGNFPKAASLGPGHIWHLIWDGVRDAETPAHIGYFAAVSQVVTRGELGNPGALTCLPVTGQSACFGMIGVDSSNMVHNSPLGDIPSLGGLSPIPVPLVQRNGMDAISLIWEQAASQVSRDGATLPVVGYQIYVYPNPSSPPTEKELNDRAFPVSEVLPVDTTAWDLLRSLPALSDTVTMIPVLKLLYGGGHESLYFSANGPSTGLMFPDTAATKAMDDAATGSGGVGRAIDIEDLFLETRQVKGENDADEAYMVATIDLIGDPAGTLKDGTQVRLFIDFNEEGMGSTFDEPGKKDTADITLVATLAKGPDGKLAATFKGLPNLSSRSRLGSQGRFVFVVPLKEVIAAAGNEKLRAADVGGGRRQVLVWADSRLDKDVDHVPNTDDGKAPSVAGEVIKFTF